jgi:hypothetical protein
MLSGVWDGLFHYYPLPFLNIKWDAKICWSRIWQYIGVVIKTERPFDLRNGTMIGSANNLISLPYPSLVHLSQDNLDSLRAGLFLLSFIPLYISMDLFNAFDYYWKASRILRRWTVLGISPHLIMLGNIIVDYLLLFNSIIVLYNLIYPPVILPWIISWLLDSCDDIQPVFQ